MDYVIGSSVSTDAVNLPDKSSVFGVLGGAGIYALAGIKLWNDNVTIASGIGPDYLKRHQRWYADNSIDIQGLVYRGSVTPVTTVTYYENGDRLDQPNVGLEEFRLLDPTLDDIQRCCDGRTKGVYVFKHLDRLFFDGLLEMKKKHGFRLMWEISEDAAIPENLRDIEEYLSHIDVFSINQKELSQLYNGLECIKAGKELVRYCGGWVYLRCGKNGAYLFADEQCYACPGMTGISVVDTTGAGNSSSAAVLYAYCENIHEPMAAAMGAVSATYCIAQYGPPKYFTASMRNNARKSAAILSGQVKLQEELNGTAEI